MVDAFALSNRRVLTLKEGKDRLAANRHPWIFAGAIARESGPADAAIADLVDPRGRRIASGFHSRHSQIRMRALTFGDEELTAEVLRNRVVASIRRRVLTAETNAARLIHAEGDDLSGLVVDLYNDVVVMEIANAGIEQLKDFFVDVIRENVRVPRSSSVPQGSSADNPEELRGTRGSEELPPRGVWLKNDIPARQLEHLSADAEWIGDGDPSTEILEHGLRFRVDPPSGQKTGFFLDQRENRQLARQLARGRRTLNLFSYSGAFGVYAAAGGAASVENVDISGPAIELAKTNHQLNGVEATFNVADAFSYVRQTKSRFDFVICDPPAFARSRGEVDRAARGYKDVNLFAMKLIDAGGLMMTFSCSGHMSLELFQKVIFSAALDAGRRVSIVRRLTAADDHPVSLYCPEGEYLKGFLLEVHA
jgi:23S rRNA (cytosine1962-C5)-methyltransferase